MFLQYQAARRLVHDIPFFVLRLTKNYERAYKNPNVAKEEVPTFAPAADKVIETAVAADPKQFESDNPR